MKSEDTKFKGTIMLAVFDSDGCVFDTMEPKHRRTFVPQVISHFALEDHEQETMEAWCRINLYSRLRGLNRFPGLAATLTLLRHEYGLAEIPRLTTLDEWIASEPVLSNYSLEEALASLPPDSPKSQELAQVLSWSEGVNTLGKEVLLTPEPFPGAEQTLEYLQSQGVSLGVVSQSPRSFVLDHWQSKNYIQRYKLAGRLFGQEDGKKADSLRRLLVQHMGVQHMGAPAPGGGATTIHSKPAANSPHCPGIFFGDAPGDLKAAEQAGYLFYPIIPGQEEGSWRNVPTWLESWQEPFLEPGVEAMEQLTELRDSFLLSLPEIQELDRQAR
jgi:beta-phosphoglucomutase-like phosphatase (HAD superfamily)